MEVAPGTIVVYADIACPWAHVAIYRLHQARRQTGLEGRITFDLHAFPLELVNRRPTPKTTLDAEIPVAGALAPDAGWQMWQRREFQYPVTTLLALEAVYAAKEQSPVASEQLDHELRVAFFGRSRTICLRHEILEAAALCDAVDVAALADSLDSGACRSRVMQDLAVAESDEVAGSPHVFLADGTNEHNPGTKIEWKGSHGRGFPVVVEDRPERYLELLDAAAAAD